MPGIAFVVLHRRRWFPGLLAAGILISYASGEHTYYNIGLYFMDFIVGAWLAMPNGPAATLFRSLPARPLFAVSMIVMALTQFLPSTYYSPTAHLIETALSAWVIGLLVFPEARIGVMASRPLLFIGDVSFSIYLLHYVVVCTLAKLFALAHLPLGVMPLAILLASLTCIISVPLAWLSFEFVEKPGVQLGKFVMAAWSGRPGVKPAARVTPEQSVLGER
jgi:peptidoglycan/LPS O-acetylase OafA/YrhL